MDEDVATTHLVEEPSRQRLRAHEAVARPEREARPSGPEPVECCELDQLGEVERALDPVDLERSAPSPSVSRSTIWSRPMSSPRRARHRRAALPELRLDGFEEVRRVVRHLEVCVSCDAKHRTLHDGDAREEPRQEMRDHLLERNEQAVSAEREKRGSPSGILMRANRSSPVSGSATNTASDRRAPRCRETAGRGLRRAE